MERYTGIKLTGKKLTNVRSRIEALFRSSDKEMWKLGQRMCHFYRISYWVKYEVDVVFGPSTLMFSKSISTFSVKKSFIYISVYNAKNKIHQLYEKRYIFKIKLK